MNSWKKSLLIFGLFSGLTLLMTYPIIFNLGSGLRDLGDPLLNTWIISWNIHKITSFDFINLFDANIFYPHSKTLAYSEFLFPQALAALPVMIISGNPVLAHNFVLLLSFITSGFGMFLLARYLTRNTYAGIIAGTIYAFSPFMFAHLFQVQVITAGGIPLAFLYLHKFFRSGSFRDILLFTLFFILQILANGYYALYLTLFAGMFILIKVIAEKKYKDGIFWLQFGLFALLAIIATGPFYYQYLVVRKEMGFSRQIGAYAHLTSFLNTGPINKVYGNITASFHRPEGELFPGIVAVLLVLLGICFSLKLKRKDGLVQPDKKITKIASFILKSINILILVWLALIIFILIQGGFEFYLFNSLRVRATHLVNPLIALVILFLIRFLIKLRLSQKRLSLFTGEEKPLRIYSMILVLSFLFTLGPGGPYILLYRYVPGFDGLRVPSRFHIFVMFSLALLAAFGARFLFMRLKKGIKLFLLLLIPLLILIEYTAFPIPLQTIPVKKDIPEVYRWLSSKKDEDFAILELPLPEPGRGIGRIECPRVYYSTYHWKKLVNGYSGYFPPLYNELRRRWQGFPLEQNIKDLKKLGVTYLIIHSFMYKQIDRMEINNEIMALEKDVKFVEKFGESYVYELIHEDSDSELDFARARKYIIYKDAWRAKSNVHNEMAGQTIDGNILTRWFSETQKKGDYFELDLGRTHSIKGISLRLGKSSQDFPRGYKIELSTGGNNWKKVAEDKIAALPLTAYLNPNDLALEIILPPQEARYIKITNTGEDKVFFWSIYELEVFE